MSTPANNSGDADYRQKLAEIAALARAWTGPIVVVAHIDPDGDAIGSSLALKRALELIGKRVILPLIAPTFLEFLARPGELSGELSALPANTLLFVVDVGDAPRAAGAPLSQAAAVINLDHHGSNSRFGDAYVVEPSKAAAALLVKELIDQLGVPWSPELATPCLAGLLSDTGNFRFSNTNREVFEVAAELIDMGVDYPALTDRLQWRHTDYFHTLGQVMATVRFELDGKLVLAHLTSAMRPAGQEDDDSDDFVSIIRYADGVKVAALLKERQDMVKISVRTRDGVSAQAICIELGGGGHVAAAGATVRGDLKLAEALLLKAASRELARHAPRQAASLELT